MQVPADCFSELRAVQGENMFYHKTQKVNGRKSQQHSE